MSTEIELKLLVAEKYLPRVRDALKQHAKGAESKRQHLISHYFDTPALQLWEKQVALRVRRMDGRWVQTLKGGGGVHAGIHQRDEWETPVDRHYPDLDLLAATFPDDVPLQRLVKKLQRQKNLQAIFSTDFCREAVILTLPDGSEAEAAIDEGRVLADGKYKPISELELELKSGNPAAAFDFARQLLVAVPLTIGVASKAERGYALVQHEKPRAPRRSKPIKLSASTKVDDAFAGIFAECVGHLLENVEGVILGHDPEYLHQMRVANRRLRGAIATFGDVLPEVASAPIAAELKKTGPILSKARNWDVLLHETLPRYEEDTRIAVSGELSDRLREEARQALTAAKRLCRSRRFTGALLAAGAFVTGRTWRRGATEASLAALSSPVIDFAKAAIEKRRRRLNKRVAAVESDDPQTLHEARIAAKKLRYSMQLFASLFPAKHAKPYIQALADFQDLLGRLNDLTVASGLVSEAASGSPELNDEVVQLNVWLEEQSQDNRRLVTKTWDRIAKFPFIPK